MKAVDVLNRTCLIARDFVSPDRTDQEIVDGLAAVNVAIVADRGNLKSGAGQSAVTTLAMLALQMGCRVRLVMRNARIQGHQPPLRGAEIREAILDLAVDLIPGGFAEVAHRTSSRDLVFVLGDTVWSGDGARAWRVHGTPWSGSISPIRAAGRTWQGDFPIGALAAAALAAAEPFKAALRTLVASSVAIDDQIAPVEKATVTLGPEVSVHSIDLGHVNCISGGAIAQSFAHAIFRVPGIGGHVHTVEPEYLDFTNLNRYALSRRSQVRWPKVETIAAVAPPGISVTGTIARLEERNAYEILRFPSTVIVGTDDIRSRWIAQATRPEWLAVGATAKFLAMCSEHPPGLPCAGCVHPIDDGVDAVIPTVSFVSYWGGLMMAARLLRHATGVECDPNDQVLWLPALRLDRRHAQLRYRARTNQACPLRCGGDADSVRPALTC